jgi:hypothetical protein
VPKDDPAHADKDEQDAVSRFLAEITPLRRRRVSMDPEGLAMIRDIHLGWVCPGCLAVATWNIGAPRPVCGDPCVDSVAVPGLAAYGDMSVAELAEVRERMEALYQEEQARRDEASRRRVQYLLATAPVPPQPDPHAIRRLKEDGRLP